MAEITIRADEQLFAVLKQIALQKRTTFEAVIQQALTDWISEHREGEARQYSFIGIGRSEQQDLSLRAEEILAEPNSEVV